MADTIIIVGGGLIGLMTASELRLSGAEVIVLDQPQSQPGQQTSQQASWAGGGIISPLYPWRAVAEITALASWSQGYYPDYADRLLADTGIDVEWVQSGLLVIGAYDQASALAWAKAHEVGIDVLSAETLADVEPGIKRVGINGAGLNGAGINRLTANTLACDILLLPQIAQIRNPRLLKAVRMDVQRLGVRVDEQIEVVDLLREGSRISGVQTTKGPRHADAVVLAAGAWTSRLLKEVDCSVEIAPVRGQMILFKARPGLVRHIVLHGDHYLVPRKDGRILVGSTLENVGFDLSTTNEAREELFQFAVGLVPALADYPIEHHWAGLRPGTSGALPSIGPLSAVEGLYINSGHFRNGVTLAPASARLLVDQMLGRKPILDPAPYNKAL